MNQINITKLKHIFQFILVQAIFIGIGYYLGRLIVEYIPIQWVIVILIGICIFFGILINQMWMLHKETK